MSHWLPRSAVQYAVLSTGVAGRALVALGEGQWLLGLLLLVGVTTALMLGVFAVSPGGL